MQFKGTATVTLPGGFWKDGVRFQEAVVRPLVGRDEAALLAAERSLSRPEWTTEVLSRCLESLGPLDSVDAGPARSLTIGDREALLLHVRRLTLGNLLPAVINCGACGEKMDLELSVEELLLPPDPHDTPVHEMMIEADGKRFDVGFRLPTGGDQEAVSAVAKDSPGEAAGLLLHRCADYVHDDQGNEVAESSWPDGLVDALSDQMERLDPQAELRINAQCPFCDHPFSLLFDTAAYFSKEMSGRKERFYREVHTLAFYYHWSESEIMHLTLRERNRYIELINETLSRRR